METAGKVDPTFDPLDPDYLADPYPYFARFRREAPVFYALEGECSGNQHE